MSALLLPPTPVYRRPFFVAHVPYPSSVKVKVSVPFFQTPIFPRQVYCTFCGVRNTLLPPTAPSIIAAACLARSIFSVSRRSRSAFVIRGFLGAPVPRPRPLPLPVAAAVDVVAAAPAAATIAGSFFAANWACVTPVAAAAALPRPLPRPLPLPEGAELYVELANEHSRVGLGILASRSWPLLQPVSGALNTQRIHPWLLPLLLARRVRRRR